MGARISIGNYFRLDGNVDLNFYLANKKSFSTSILELPG